MYNYVLDDSNKNLLQDQVPVWVWMVYKHEFVQIFEDHDTI